MCHLDRHEHFCNDSLLTSESKENSDYFLSHSMHITPPRSHIRLRGNVTATGDLPSCHIAGTRQSLQALLYHKCFRFLYSALFFKVTLLTKGLPVLTTLYIIVARVI